MSQTMNNVVIRNVFTDPDAFATTLVILLIDIYGTEFLYWAPETVRLETEDDFNFKWPIANFDRLMAGVALLTTDRFYKNLPDFINLCNILSGSPATIDIFDPADAAECAWGITEALLLAPPDDNDENPFIEEIRAYIAEVLKMEGIITAPDILRLADLPNNRKFKVQTDFSDDPILYNAIWDAEKEKTDDINNMVKSNLILLVKQLESLKLKHGNTADVTKKMFTQLTTTAKGDQPL